MSDPTHTDEPAGTPPSGRPGSKLMKTGAAAAAAVALVFGAKAIAGANASTSTADAASGAPARPLGGPPGMARGFASDVTGDTLTRLEAAVADRYPGTVERAMKLPDGSYVVHVIGSGGRETHVHVSKELKVLGADQGGPGRFDRRDGDRHMGGPPPGCGAGTGTEQSGPS
jgi:hypothetical protein